MQVKDLPPAPPPSPAPRRTTPWICPPPPLPLQVKDLELTNPSKKAISYTAKLEGHKDFGIEGAIVRVDPKASSRFPIKCNPTTSLPQEARLVLLSRK